MSIQGREFVHPLAPPHCLGPYRQHPQIRVFEMAPTAVLEGERFWAHLPELLRAPPQHSLQFGPSSQYRLAPLLQSLAPDFVPEVLIWWGIHHPLPQDLQALKAFKILIVSDWHFYARLLEGWIQDFDLILCDRLLLQRLQAAGVEHASYWPAFAFDPLSLPSPAKERDLEVVFVGKHHPAYYRARNQVLWHWAASDLPCWIRSDLPHEDYLKLLGRSQIVLNHALRRELNLRSAEVAAMGGLLFCEAENLELFDVLPPGEACVAYTRDNLLEQLRYYLQHPNERLALAREGQRRMQKHSYEANFARLLEQLPRWRKQYASRNLPGASHSAERRRELEHLALGLINPKAVERLRALVQAQKLYLQSPTSEAHSSLWAYAYYALLISCWEQRGEIEGRHLPEFSFVGDFQSQRQILEKQLQEAWTQTLKRGDSSGLSGSATQHAEPYMPPLTARYIAHNLAWGAFFSEDPHSFEQAIRRFKAVKRHDQTQSQEQAEQKSTGDAQLRYWELFLLPVRKGPFHLLRQSRALEAQDLDSQELAPHMQFRAEQGLLGDAPPRPRLLEAGELYLMGQWALKKQNLHGALLGFSGAAQRLPVWAEAHFACAHVQLAQGQTEAALLSLERGIQQGVFYPQAWLLWIQLLCHHDRTAARQRKHEALRLFQGEAYADFRDELQRLPC